LETLGKTETRGQGFEPRQKEPKSFVLPLHHPQMGLFYIILPTPHFVNARSSSLAFGSAVHCRMATILPVTTSDFPNWFDIQFDSFCFLAVGHNKEPVVVVVDNNVEQGTGKGTVVATVEVAGSCSK
jgi:hypothetical protein